MVSQFFRWSPLGVTALTVGLAVGAIAPLLPSNATPVNVAQAKTAFPDIQNHWARPFIEPLAEQGIVAGYPDGTYQPEQTVDRDEFAAILRQAFNQEQERRIASGAVYKDVPTGYWAESAIEEAYQMGFMKGYPGGFFRPQQPVSRVEALVALTQNLNLEKTEPTASQAMMAPAAAPSTNAQPATTAAAQPSTRQPARRQFMYPMAITSLMQPFMTAPARAVNTAIAADPTTPAQNQAAAQNQVPTQNQAADTTDTPVASNSLSAAPAPVSVVVSNNYTDAEKIPQYAVDEVARATQAGIVVNPSNPQVLNPTQPATRADIAAFVHQALVNQGRLEPIPVNVEANNYIVEDR